MHTNFEKIRDEILTQIRDSLREAWNRGRLLDVIREEMTEYTTSLESEKCRLIKEKTQILEQQFKRNKNQKINDINIQKNVVEEAKRAYDNVLKQNQWNTSYYSSLSYQTQQAKNNYDNAKNKLTNLSNYDPMAEFNNKLRSETTRINHEIYSLRDKKQKQLVEKYNDEFTQSWKSIYLDKFKEQYKLFNPQELRKKLLLRHPWLDSEQNYPRNRLVDKFLKAVLQKIFWTCLKHNPGDYNYWNIDLEKNAKLLIWNPISPDWLQKVIQGYPLSFQFYHENLFPSNFDQNLDLFTPTRFDLYHLSINHSSFIPKKFEGEIYCIPVVAMILSELVTLSELEINQMQILFVNIATEENPSWILLHQHQRSCTIYVPEILNQQRVERLKKQFPGVKQVLVDLSGHGQLNDLKLSKTVIWHAAMVARVFPWCRGGNVDKDLTSYRENVPASVLLEHALYQLIPKNSTSTKNRVTKSFANRQPYSKYTLPEHYSQVSIDSTKLPPTEHLLGSWEWNGLDSKTVAEGLLKALENKSITFAKSIKNPPSPDTLVFTGKIENHVFFHAIKLAEHHGLSHLILGECEGVKSLLENFNHYTYKMVTTNLNITSVCAANVTSLIPYAYLYHCAARNRFMQQMKPKYLADNANQVIPARQKLWSETGKSITDFYKHHAIEVDTALNIIEYNRIWRESQCADDHRPTGDMSEKIWKFVQLAQMGTQGLDVFFQTLETDYTNNWDATFQEPAPKLSCTFDLEGSLTDKAADYIHHLSTKITNFGAKRKCAPLFENLALMLPEHLGQDELNALEAFFISFSQRKQAYANEPDELVLYNIEIDSIYANDLLRMLEKISINSRLQISIRIPTWDRAACDENSVHATIKAVYRRVQNILEDNLRAARLPQLAINTQPLKDYCHGHLKPDWLPNKHEAQMSQFWSEEDVFYPLTSQAPGIQQQLQQQIGQAYQQQAQKQIQVAENIEVVRSIGKYNGPEDDLITRENIEDRGRAYWNSLPETCRNRSGIQSTDSLDVLLSLWVGSQKNASEVIERIEPAAMRKLMDYAPNFRLGIDWNRTPGFRVARSVKDGRLILTFSERLEKQDLMEQQQAKLNHKRDPFARQLAPNQAARVFRGDYRQFELFGLNSDNCEGKQQPLPTYWVHLAEEKDGDQIREANIQAAAIKLQPNSSPDQATAILAHHNVSQVESVAPLDLSHQKSWAKNIHTNEGFVNALFDNFNLKQLKALGQLFNKFDSLTPIKHDRIDREWMGTTSWLRLAHEIYQVFPNYFEIWKQRLLNEREDWSEVLDPEELHAIARSMLILKENEDYKAILWALVDAHGHAVGPMRFAEIWYGFEQIIQYLEVNKLFLNKDMFVRYLENTKNDQFNATNFLYRLNFVLQHIGKRQDCHDIQQRLLDNVDKIDWRHSGLYYACRYEQYPYWQPELGLSNLNSFIANNPLSATYNVSWDDTKVLGHISQPVPYALRYSVKHMHVGQMYYDQLKNFLLNFNHIFNDNQGQLVLRMVMASLAVGVDDVREWPTDLIQPCLTALLNSTYIDLLVQINRAIQLDQSEVVASTYQMRLVDVALFLEVFADNQFAQTLQNKNISLDLALLNLCGHALHCFARHGKNLSEQKEALKKWLHFLVESAPEGLSHPLVSIYPWLIDEMQVNAEATSNKFEFNDPIQTLQLDEVQSDYQDAFSVFERQLKSINPKLTTWFPLRQDLSEAFQSIASAENPDVVRQQIVTRWIQTGCAITDQNAPYRPLTSSEILSVQENPHLKFSLAFSSCNKSLFNQLLRYLAVETNQSLDNQIKPLLLLFSKIDSKLHYNELAQILGLLIEKAYEGQKNRYYSIEQLNMWLTTLFNEQEFATKPYPNEFLKEFLLDAVTDSASSLLNDNLHALRPEDETSIKMKQYMMQIKASKLSYRSQKVLVKLIVKLKTSSDLNRCFNLITVALKYINADQREDHFCQLVTHLLSEGQLPEHLRCLHPLAISPPQPAYTNQRLNTLKYHNQLKFLDGLLKETIDFNAVNTYFASNLGEQETLINQIIAASFEGSRNLDDTDLNLIHNMFLAWSIKELTQLATYYLQAPTPNQSELAETLTFLKNSSADELVHHYETVIQATDRTTQLSKRQYSVSPQDLDDLKRVLAGFKLKGKGFIKDDEQKELLNLLYYTNTYSQLAELSQCNHQTLTQTLHIALNEVKQSDGIKQHQAMARVLACMREVLLRKTGKWANHTQMLDLLYGALHNDESLMHQVRTGEGKSIITVMRNAYRALNGQIIDIFSSKDSLSSRDHDEFKMVFDAFGIRHSHITEKSAPKLYHTELNQDGIGAVNYITVGNLSLFLSGAIWQGLAKFDLQSPKRVAYIDEADHILRDEHTQYNLSDSDTDASVYNFDEWVYREAYDFYLKNRHKFKGIFEGAPVVSRNQGIRELCEQLQASETTMAPEESRFFEEYIIPALKSPNPDNFENRDQQLCKLLTAAHMAYAMKENTDYSVMPETRTVAEGVGLDTRFAKVVINNQVYHGSTYSDLVQQFLHVRLNLEAFSQGKMPNFFIEPNSEIALSLNASYVIKNYYSHVEACTGTSGDSEDLAYYRKEYKINRVIKLPTHEEIKTEFLSPIYVGDDLNEDLKQKIANKTLTPQEKNQVIKQSQHAQVTQIVDQILTYRNQPILITCEDDNAVEALGAEIRFRLSSRQLDDVLDERLKDSPGQKNPKFILDTNRSGRTEADILPFAGRNGSVTISSRMGRGTDIKVADKNIGLFVIRTYPISPRVEKQEIGRQGRNGASGKCLNILNYSAILFEYQQYEQEDSPYYDRLRNIYEFEEQHLNKKLAKHQKLNKENKQIWKNLSTNPNEKIKYLKTRSLQRLKQEIKRESNLFIRRKENVLAILSAHLMEVLPQITDQNELTTFKNKWKKVRRFIDAAWNRRLTNQSGGDTEEIFAAFFNQTNHIWQDFSKTHGALNPTILVQISEDERRDNAEDVSNDASNHGIVPQPTQLDDACEVIAFYQTSCSGREKYIFNPPNPIQSSIRNALLGANGQDIDELFIQIKQASCHDECLIDSSNNVDSATNDTLSETQSLTKRRKHLFQTLNSLYNQYSSCYVISAKVWKTEIEALSTTMDLTILASYPEWLETFFSSIQDKTPSSLKSDQEVKRIGNLFLLMMRIYKQVFISENQASSQLTVDLVDLLLNRHVGHFSDTLLNNIEILFSKNMTVGSFMTRHSNKAALDHMLSALVAQQNQPDFSNRMQVFIQYIEKNLVFLQNHPACIRPAFDLLVARQKRSFVPDNQMLTLLCNETQFDITGIFLNFLANRPGYTDTDYQKFIQAVNPSKRDARWISSLPPYMSVGYLTAQLSDALGPDDAGQLEDRLKSITRVAHAFNAFLCARGVIITKETFNEPRNLAVYQQWTACFENMPRTISQTFFTVTKDCYAMSDSVMLTLADAFVSHKLSVPDLHATADVFKIIQKLPKWKRQWFDETLNKVFKSQNNAVDGISKEVQSLENLVKLIELSPGVSPDLLNAIYTAWFSAVNGNPDLHRNLSIYLNVIASIPSEWVPLVQEQFLLYVQTGTFNPHHLKAMTHFAECLRDRRLNGFTLLDLGLLNTLWMRDFDEKKLINHLAVSQSLLGLYPSIFECLRAKYFNILTNQRNSSDKFADFVSCVRQYDLKPQAIEVLFEHFYDKSLDEIKSAIEVIKLATRCAEDEPLLAKYFVQLDQHKQERVLLMRYIHQGLLDFLGEQFKNKCLDKHRTLNLVSTSWVATAASSNRDPFVKGLQEWYHSICEVMHELLEVMRFQVANRYRQDNQAQIKETQLLQNSFRQYQTDYAKFWFSANHTRKNQAKSFFDNLSNTNLNRNNQLDYYNQILTKICETQQTITLDDQNVNRRRWFTHLHAKGYSRFYDITHQILGDVLRHYHQAMTLGKITNDQSVQLQRTLGSQLGFHVNTLIDVLPTACPLRKKLEIMKNEHSEQNSLCDDDGFWNQDSLKVGLRNIVETDLKVPKHLQHLLENVRCYLTLTETNLLRVESMPCRA